MPIRSSRAAVLGLTHDGLQGDPRREDVLLGHRTRRLQGLLRPLDQRHVDRVRLECRRMVFEAPGDNSHFGGHVGHRRDELLARPTLPALGTPARRFGQPVGSHLEIVDLGSPHLRELPDALHRTHARVVVGAHFEPTPAGSAAGSPAASRDSTCSNSRTKVVVKSSHPWMASTANPARLTNCPVASSRTPPRSASDVGRRPERQRRRHLGVDRRRRHPPRTRTSTSSRPPPGLPCTLALRHATFTYRNR